MWKGIFCRLLILSLTDDFLLQEGVEIRKVEVGQAKAVVLRLHPPPLLHHRLIHLEQGKLLFQELLSGLKKIKLRE